VLIVGLTRILAEVNPLLQLYVLALPLAIMVDVPPEHNVGLITEILNDGTGFGSTLTVTVLMSEQLKLVPITL
jgi:hypothetical protein